MPQEYNAQLIEQLAADFPRRKEPNYAWGNALSGLLLTPRLLTQYAFTIDNNWNLYDMSGGGRMLTGAGGGGTRPIPILSGITPWINFIAANTQYYTRADEPNLDLYQYASIWTWVRFDAPMTGAQSYIYGKWDDTVANQRSYLFYKAADNSLRFYISSAGTFATSYFATDLAANYVQDKWIFLAGSFTSGTTVDLYVGIGSTGKFTRYQTAIGAGVANIFNGTAALQVGGNTPAGVYHDGGLSLFGMAGIDLQYVTAFNMFHQTRPLFMW